MFSKNTKNTYIAQGFSRPIAVFDFAANIATNKQLFYKELICS